MSSGSSNQGGSSPSPNPKPGSNSPNPVRRRISEPNPSIGNPNRSPGSILGVQGQTAFSAYNSPAGQSGPGGSSTAGSGYLAVSGPIPAPPINVGPTGIPTGTVIRLGGGPIVSPPSAKKRVRDRGASASGGSGSQQAAAGGVGGGGGEVHACSLCPRTFSSTKALFGHMRCHPDRGWKGAHPPPTFNVEEEFGDLPGVNIAAGVGGLAAEKAVNDGEGEDVVADEVGENDEEVAAGAEEEAVVVEAPKPFRGFDLNSSPPLDD